MMTKIRKHVAEFIRSEDGPTAVEYAVMVALIIIVCITAISGLSSAIQNSFNEAASTIDNAGPAAS